MRDAIRRAFVAAGADPGGHLGLDQFLQPGLQQPTHRIAMINLAADGEEFLNQPAHGRLVPMGHRGVPSRVTWSFLES